MSEQLNEKAFDVATKIVNESRGAVGKSVSGITPYLTLSEAVEELGLLLNEEANIIISLGVCGQECDKALLIEWIAEMLTEKYKPGLLEMLREDFLKPLLPVFDRMKDA